MSEQKHSIPADGEILSKRTYPKEYKGPKPIVKQIEMLAKKFKLSPDRTIKFVEKVLPSLTLPSGAEGWFAFPSVNALADRFFPKVVGSEKRLCEATKFVLTNFKDSRKFTQGSVLIRMSENGKFVRKNNFDNFRLSTKTLFALSILTQQQKGDIWIVGGQFGNLHAGRSIERTRELMVGSEFGAHTIAVGSMLITHPERLASHKDLWPEIPGDEYGPGSSTYGMFFSFGNGIFFNKSLVGSPTEQYGSVSLFLPK